MDTPQAHPRVPQDVRRRDLLKAGLAAGVTLSAWPLQMPSMLWGAEAGQPKHGGVLRVRGYDPPHFDPLTLNFKAQTTLSFVYSRLVRHKVGAEVSPGTFTVEPDLAERWEQPDDTTYIFHLRHGVHWQNKPPVNGRELVAEDVKFTYDRFLTEKGNTNHYLLDSVDRVEVVDPRSTDLARHDQPCLFQLLEVLHDAEAGHLQLRLELGQRASVPLEEQVEQPPPARVGQGLEDPVVVHVLRD